MIASVVEWVGWNRMTNRERIECVAAWIVTVWAIALVFGAAVLVTVFVWDGLGA